MTIASALRHHHLWLVGTVVLCLLAATAATHLRTPTYQASARLQVDATDAVGQGSIDVASQETRANQLIQLLESEPLLARVCHSTAIRGMACNPASLGRQVTASLVNSTTMISITVTAAQAASAALLANQIADEVVGDQRQQATQFYAAPIQRRTAQLQQVAAQIAGEEQQISLIESNPVLQPGDKDQIAAPHFTQLDVLQSQYASLATNVEDLQLSQLSAQQAVAVAQRAQVPPLPEDPNLLHYLAAGAAAGLILGFLLMLLMARLDQRIRHGQAFAAAADLPLVFEIPWQRAAETVTAACSSGAAGLLARRPAARSVLVVASDRSANVRGTVCQLAAAMHGLGHDVRVVVEKGLESEAAVVASRERHLDTVTPATALRALPGSGDREPGPVDRHLVVFGVGAPERSPLAMLLAPHADIVVLIGARDRTTGQAARRAADLLRHVGAEVQAGILVRRRWLGIGGGLETPGEASTG